MKKIFIALFALTFVAVPCMADKHPRMTSKQFKETSELMRAVGNIDLVNVHYWLDRGASADIWRNHGSAYDSFSWSYMDPLRSAVEVDSYFPIYGKRTIEEEYETILSIMQTLIDHGADMNESALGEASALLRAVEIAEHKIYEKGYNPNRIEIRKLKLLLDNGAKKHILNKADRNILHPAINVADKSLELAKLLLSYDITVRKSDIRLAKKLQDKYKGTKWEYNYNRLVELLESKRDAQREASKKLLKEELKRAFLSYPQDPTLWKY